MSYIIFAMLGAIFRGAYTFFVKVNCMRRGNTDQFLLNFYVVGSICLTLLICFEGQSGFFDRLSTGSMREFSELAVVLYTILFGFLLGISLIAANKFLALANGSGPAGLTSAIINSNTIFTILLATFYYGEGLLWHRWLGVGLILCGVLLLPLDFSKSLRINNVKWYYFATMAMLCFFPRNSGLKIIAEMGLSKDWVLLIAYLVGLVWFMILALRKNSEPINRMSVLLGAGGGLLSSTGIWFYGYAFQIGREHANIIAVIFSLSIVLISLLAWIFYREKLSIMQLGTIVMVIIGCLLIGWKG